jgi:uncharacterized protein (DUF1778 family)
MNENVLRFATHFSILIIMVAVTHKQENIHFRISSDAKSVIDKAVVASGQSLTEFATQTLLRAANEVLEREFTTVLSNRDRDLLLALLDEDAKPNKALRKAAAMHKNLIGE